MSLKNLIKKAVKNKERRKEVILKKWGKKKKKRKKPKPRRNERAASMMDRPYEELLRRNQERQDRVMWDEMKRAYALGREDEVRGMPQWQKEKII